MDTENENGTTTLMLATEAGRIDLVQALLNQGNENVNAVDKEGNNAFLTGDFFNFCQNTFPHFKVKF